MEGHIFTGVMGVDEKLFTEFTVVIEVDETNPAEGQDFKGAVETKMEEELGTDE